MGSWQTSYDEGTTWYPGSPRSAQDSVRSFQITSSGQDVWSLIPAS